MEPRNHRPKDLLPGRITLPASRGPARLPADAPRPGHRKGMSAFLSCTDPLALVFFPSNCCLKTHLWLVFIVAVTCHCMVEVTRTLSKLESGSSGFSDEAASALSLAVLIWFQQEPRWVSLAKDPPAAVISHPPPPRPAPCL